MTTSTVIAANRAAARQMASKYRAAIKRCSGLDTEALRARLMASTETDADCIAAGIAYGLATSSDRKPMVVFVHDCPWALGRGGCYRRLREFRQSRNSFRLGPQELDALTTDGEVWVHRLSTFVRTAEHVARDLVRVDYHFTAAMERLTQ